MPKYITRLASNEIFSPPNKINREVGRAKDLSAPLVPLGKQYNLEAHPYSVFSNLVRFPPSSVPTFSRTQIQGHRKPVREFLTKFLEDWLSVAQCLGLGTKDFIFIQQIMLLEKDKNACNIIGPWAPFRTAGFRQFAPAPAPPTRAVLTIASFVAVLPSEQRVKSHTDLPYSSQILEQRWFKAGRRIQQPDLKVSKFLR
jgi:hypothetical protein